MGLFYINNEDHFLRITGRFCLHLTFVSLYLRLLILLFCSLWLCIALCVRYVLLLLFLCFCALFNVVNVEIFVNFIMNSVFYKT